MCDTTDNKEDKCNEYECKVYECKVYENKKYELAFPDGVYQWVHTMCYLHPIHISLGVYYEMYLCALMGFALFCTSFNYWRNPIVPSFARNLDVFVVFSAGFYHFYLSLYTINTLLCFGTGSAGVLLYPVSLCFQHKYNCIRAAAVCHCLLHMFISLSACFLYHDYNEQGLNLKWNLY